MSWFSPVRPLREGGYRLRLGDDERRLVRDLCGELRERIEGDDPGVARLFPPAFRDDPEASAQYDELVRAGLVDGRLAALQRVERTSVADELSEEDANAWCGALNDLRLVLGERLGVTEDLDYRSIPRDHPRAQEYALYVWLTYLQGALVEALASRL
jgi:hypothetical protein